MSSKPKSPSPSEDGPCFPAPHRGGPGCVAGCLFIVVVAAAIAGALTLLLNVVHHSLGET
jgi:hypothetical protein